MNQENKQTIIVIDDAIIRKPRRGVESQFDFMTHTLTNVIGSDSLTVLPPNDRITFRKFKNKTKYGAMKNDKEVLIKAIQRVLKAPNDEKDTIDEIKEYFAINSIDGFCIDYELFSENPQRCNAYTFFTHFIKQSANSYKLLFHSSQFDEQTMEIQKLKKLVEESGYTFTFCYLPGNLRIRNERASEKIREAFLGTDAKQSETEEKKKLITPNSQHQQSSK